MERCSTPPSDALPARGVEDNREHTYPKTKMTKDKETQYERTGQIQQRDISGHDLLSRFEEYRKRKRKKGTEKTAMKENWIYRRGDVYLATSTPYIGSEQGGTALWSSYKTTPATTDLLADHRAHTSGSAQAVPTYSTTRPSASTGWSFPAWCQLEQIKTIDQAARRKKYLGRMTRSRWMRSG